MRKKIETTIIGLLEGVNLHVITVIATIIGLLEGVNLHVITVIANATKTN